jgi:hypothetical protein
MPEATIASWIPPGSVGRTTPPRRQAFAYNACSHPSSFYDPGLAVWTFPTRRAGVGHPGQITEMGPCVMPGTTIETMSGMM